MVKLSKKMEYALMALKHFAAANDSIVTAKEISEKYKIPYELLSKILQKLKKDNVLTSIQGTKGGYRLNKKPEEIDLHFLVQSIDGDIGMTECQCSENKGGKCTHNDDCSIKEPVSQMQKEIEELFRKKTILDFV